jgi:pimeloyl-ACP methyl ester carboxylesterase
VTCPTLFVLGRRDVMTPARSASNLTAAIKHGKIVNVDAGHAMMAEQPEAVREALANLANACT